MSKFYKPELDLGVDVSLDVPDQTICVHDNIPVFPSYSVVVGTGGSGKTLMIVSLLEKIKPVFKGRLVVFTSSFTNTLNESVNRLKGKIFTTLHNDAGIDRVESILDFQRKQKAAGHKLKPFLIIFDDFISDRVFNKKRSVITKLFAMARHYNVSVIVTSQSFKLLPAAVRKLSHYFMLYSTANTKELKSIAEECSSYMSEKDFTKLFQETTAEKHSFLFVDCNNKRMLKNFDEVVSSKY